MSTKDDQIQLSQKELKVKSLKEMKERLKLNIGSRKCLDFVRQMNKTPSFSDEDIQTVKSEKLKLSIESSNSKPGEDPQRFEEKYKILNKLGEGSNGVVHRCLNTCTGRIYAVKQSKCDIEHVNSMKQSYVFTKKLKHENIVKYRALYIDSQKRKANLVMELFDFPQLSKVTLEGETQLRDIAKSLLSAVAEMHKIGVCHRDIKPDNILYDQKNKKIKVVDMGISKEVGIKKSHKKMLTCTGTLFYKAPEMFKGGFYDEAIDEWAVGVSLYKLVCGKTPFQSQYISTTIENIEKGRLDFGADVWSPYSYFCKDLIKRLLSPRPTRILAKDALNHLWFDGNSELVKSIVNIGDGYEKNNTSSFRYQSLSWQSEPENGSPITKKELKSTLLGEEQVVDSDYMDSCEQDDEDEDEVDSVHFSPEAIKL